MCTRTKRFLKASDIRFVEKNVEKDETFMKEALETGLSAMPIVKVEGHEPFGGHQQRKLEELFGSL